jgi:hypothetical protein
VICGKTDEEEGFGKAVICNGCSASQSEKMGSISKAPLENKDEVNFKFRQTECNVTARACEQAM